VSSAPPTINSLWVGDKLNFIERLCVASALATGHGFRLFSYDPDKLQGVPDGVELRDAADIMPREKLISYADTGAVALGANFWRYHLLSKGFSPWCDMDLLFLKQFPKSDYVFGWEHAGWINNAVMAAPADSPFVHDLLTLPRPNVRPPWFGPRRSLLFYLRRFWKGHIGFEDMPWGTYSAGLVTHLVKKHHLTKTALGPSAFYPVTWADAQTLYGPAAKIEKLIRPDTIAVHLWHSRLGDLRNRPPPEGSYIAKAAKRLGVEFEG
jgi:hypothetical protein